MACDHSWQTPVSPGSADVFFLDTRPPRFAADAEGFHPVNAWWLSELSRLIYHRDASEGVGRSTGPSRNDFLARVGLTERRFFNAPAVRAALVETVDAGEGAFTALVFRGTAGRLSNWLTNLDMVLCPWPSGGRVHRGFRNSLIAVREIIAPELAQVQRPLFFTGHSLGGALATLAASLRPLAAIHPCRYHRQQSYDDEGPPPRPGTRFSGRPRPVELYGAAAGGLRQSGALGTTLPTTPYRRPPYR